MKHVIGIDSFAEGKSDKEILDHLLKNSRYDKRLLPPVDGKLFFFVELKLSIVFLYALFPITRCVLFLNLILLERRMWQTSLTANH